MSKCSRSAHVLALSLLALPAVPEATDAIRAWWMGEHVSLNELYSPVSAERITAIFADSEEHLEQAMELGELLGRG